MNTSQVYKADQEVAPGAQSPYRTHLHSCINAGRHAQKPNEKTAAFSFGSVWVCVGIEKKVLSLVSFFGVRLLPLWEWVLVFLLYGGDPWTAGETAQF